LISTIDPQALHELQIVLSASVSSKIRIWNAKPGEYLGFQSFHLGSVVVILMIIALCMQHAMYDKMGRMLFHRQTLLGGFL
jgi:uncharacterized membrane protein